MIEILNNYWIEIVFGLLCISCLLLIIFINICYQEIKRANDSDNYADLKKMMPKLPKEKKRK